MITNSLSRSSHSSGFPSTPYQISQRSEIDFLQNLLDKIQRKESFSLEESCLAHYQEDIFASDFHKNLFEKLKRDLPAQCLEQIEKRFNRSIDPNGTILLWDLLIYEALLRKTGYFHLANIVETSCYKILCHKHIGHLNKTQNSEDASCVFQEEIPKFQESVRGFFALRNLLHEVPFEQVSMCDAILTAATGFFSRSSQDEHHVYLEGLIDEMIPLVYERSLGQERYIMPSPQDRSVPFFLWVHPETSNTKIFAISNPFYKKEPPEMLCERVCCVTLDKNPSSWEALLITTSPLYIVQGQKDFVETSEENYEKVLFRKENHPSTLHKYFPRSPASFLGNIEDVSVLCLNHTTDHLNLMDEISSAPFTFSIQELLQVCRQINKGLQELGQHRLTYEMDLKHVLFKKEHGMIKTTLMPFGFYNYNEAGKDLLSSKDILSTNTELSLHFLKNLLCLHGDTTFLDEKSSLEKRAFQKALSFLELVDAKHLEKVKEIQDQHHSLGEGFATDVFLYAKEVETSGDGFAALALTFLAYKIAIIPELIPLVSHLEESTEHLHSSLSRLENRNCSQAQDTSFENIENVLTRCSSLIEKLERISIKSHKTEYTSIPEEDFTQLVQKWPLPKDASDSLKNILHSFLKEEPEVGSCLRFHKNTLYKGEIIPCSFWITVHRQGIDLLFFQDSIETGETKKYKNAIQMRLVRGEPPVINPLCAFRILPRISFTGATRSLSYHRALTNDPDLAPFFLPPKVLFPPHQGFRGFVKQEGFFFDTQDTLDSQLVFDKTLKARRFLTTQEKISCLKHITQAIFHLSQKGLCYGKLKPSSISIFLEETGSIAARLSTINGIRSFGMRTKQDSPYSNSIRKLTGYISKETDLRNLIFCITNILLPDNSAEWEALQKNSILDDKIIEKVDNKIDSQYVIALKTVGLYSDHTYTHPTDLLENEEFMKSLQEQCTEQNPIYLDLKEKILNYLFWKGVKPLLKKLLKADYACDFWTSRIVSDPGFNETSTEKLKIKLDNIIQDADFPSIQEVLEYLDNCQNILTQMQ